MLAGVVGNTDGRADAMKMAADLLRECGAQLLIHCGDVGGRHVLDAMAEFDAVFVWGDADKDRMGLLRHAQRIGVACSGVLADFAIDDKRIAVIHGDDRKVFQRLVDEQQYDFVLYGHGHVGEDRVVGKTTLVHPGSLYGAPTRTAVLLDTDIGQIRRLTL
jgi:putative phosphoesterase